MLLRFVSALTVLSLCRIATAETPPSTPAPSAPAPPAAAPLPPSAAPLEPTGRAADASPATAAPVSTAEPAPPPSTPPVADDSAASIPAGAMPASPSPVLAHETALRGPLLLQLEGFDDAAEVEELRAALSAEFGCLIVLKAEDTRYAPTGRLVVARHPDTGELAITFVDTDEQSSTRVVQEPADPGERTRTVTMLAGTLARPPEGEGPAPAPPTAAEPPPPPPVHVAVASFFYPLASNFDAADVHTYFSFSLLYGRIGSLDGLGLGTLQFASRQVQGAQFGFLGNAAGQSVAGVQGALGVNSAGSLSGLQVAAINHVAGATSGAQLGLLNYAGGDVTGVQSAFSLNIARHVRGGQLGLVNVAQHVRGLQVGIINVAERVDGVPIGLISVTKNGGVHPITWYSSVTPFNAGLKFSTEYTYTFLNASWEPYDELVGPGFGMGGTVPAFLDQLFVDIDLSGTYLFRDSGPAEHGRTLARLRGTVRYQIFPHLSVFAGGGYTGKIEPERFEDGTVGEAYYQSLGEFVAGIGL